MNALRLLITAALAATLIACEETPETSVRDDITESFFAKFDPSVGTIPFPNNVLFLGTADATLNIPTTDLTGGEKDLADAMNTMDGFSTIAPISTAFSSAIDASTLVAGTTVRVFEVTLSGVGGAVIALDPANELTSTDFVAAVSTVDGSDANNPDPGANKLVITPLKPLKAGTSYAVVITNGVKDKSGNAAAADLIYTFIKNETELVTPFPATNLNLSEVNYAGLLLKADTDLSGDIDPTEAAAALESVNGLEGLRQLTVATEGMVATNASPAITKSEIILSWVFTTQSNGLSANHPLNRAYTAIAADPATSINTTADGTTADFGGAGAANIHVGTIDIPYYLAADDDAQLGAAGPAVGFWENSGGAGSFITPIDSLPVAQSTQRIPLLLSIPLAGSGPWPVVIFQHGITADRTSLLAIADNLAARGFAAVAIDLPLHGLLASADTGGLRDATNTFDATVQERHFDVDYVTNSTGLSPGDGNIDTSGANFVNLPNMMTTRDNLYQSIADLFVLTKSLNSSVTGMDYTGDGNGDFDASRIYFIGHSLGAIVGASFLAIETNVKDAVLAMPGGGIAKLLDGSSEFSPVIAAGLANAGVNKGTTEFESFLASAQMMIDAGDPVNYATTLAASTEGILMFEVVGDGGTNKSDLVIPNAVPDANDTSGTIAAPLSGTNPLVTLMDLTHLNADDATTNLHVVTKFNAGDHRSLLDSSYSATVFAEMQYQAAQFLLGDGALDVSDTGVLQAP